MTSIYALIIIRAFTAYANSLEWQEEQWKALLHFESKKSNITQGYFLDPEGKTSLEKEWLATENIKKENIAEASCRYPARAIIYGWYREDPDLEVCKRWIHYRNSFSADQVELVFASAFINSPSSMYGHTLLKFRSNKKNELLDYTLNYGADTGNVVGLPYVWKGLTGGFSGYFAAAPFYLKIKEYNFVENRDFWIFSLKLKKEEVDILVAHSWELRDAVFPYYFLKKNCSYYLLDFLKVVRPNDSLTGSYLFWAVPMDTIRTLKFYGLVEDARYRPSRYSKIKKVMSDISVEKENDLKVVRAKKEPKLANSASIAYELYQYDLERKKQEKDPTYEDFLLSHMKEESRDLFSVKIPPNPLLGHESSRIGLFYNKAYLELNYRGTLHDLLSDSISYEEGSELSMGDLYLRKKNKNFFLHRFDILRLRSLSPNFSWSKKTSWYFLIGAGSDEESIRCSTWNCLQARVEGGYGATWSILNTNFFILVEPIFHYGSSLEKSHRFRIGPRVGVYRDLWKGAKLISEYKQLFRITGDKDRYRGISAGLSQALARNLESRVYYQYLKKSHWKFGLNYYF